MDMNPYLTFDGDCAEAMAFYADIMGGKIIMMQKFGDMPGADPANAAQNEKVMHAQLQLGDKLLMASDQGDMGTCEPPRGFNMQTAFDTVDQARRVFEKLAEGGEVTMPFEKTFWAAGFGMCRDRFGIPWMVNCDNPD